MSESVRVGSRTSRLAAWQTDHVIASLEAAWPGIRCERVPIRTLGDRVTDVPLPRIGDRGLFTKDIEEGLRGGSIEWNKDNHFRTKLYYRVYKWDTGKSSVVQVSDWKSYDVK